MPAVEMSATRAKIVVVGASRGLCDAKRTRWKQDDSSHRERFNEHGANKTRDLVAVASQFQTMGKKEDANLHTTFMSAGAPRRCLCLSPRRTCRTKGIAPEAEFVLYVLPSKDRKAVASKRAKGIGGHGPKKTKNDNHNFTCNCTFSTTPHQ